MPEARPGAAEYGNQSIIRQQKTRPAGRIYFGCGRVFIVEKPPVLHMRAKPCITGMRARWRKYGSPAAKILLPAARKRAYSSIVRCFPLCFPPSGFDVLHDFYRILSCDILAQPQCDICKSSSYAITHLHHSAESDKQKQALSHRLACYGLCCDMSQQLVCNRVWTCSFPSYCVSSLFAFDRTRRLLQKLKKSTSQMNSKKCSHSIAKPVAYSFELRHSS